MKQTSKKKMPVKPGKKKIIVFSYIFAVIVVVAILLYFFVLKPYYEEALTRYSDILGNYNEVFSEYNDKKSQIEAENEKLDAAIVELQSLVSSGEKPYDPETITGSNDAINQGKIALTDIPVWNDKKLKSPGDYSVFQVISLKNDADEIMNYSSELEDIVESMHIVDNTAVIGIIKDAQATLEHSIQQMKQVTCPDESFVLQRINNIRDAAGMTDVISLTEDNDPENYIGKAGWYTTKVIFRHKDVEHYGLDNGLLSLNEVGNPAGGCVEVYRTEEDATRRAEELKGQEGTVRSPGARVVCGTVVIRVSDDLKASYQKELLEMISSELLRVE